MFKMHISKFSTWEMKEILTQMESINSYSNTRIKLFKKIKFKTICLCEELTNWKIIKRELVLKNFTSCFWINQAQCWSLVAPQGFQVNGTRGKKSHTLSNPNPKLPSMQQKTSKNLLSTKRKNFTSSKYFSWPL